MQGFETMPPPFYLICSAGVWDNVPTIYRICSVGFPVSSQCLPMSILFAQQGFETMHTPLYILFVQYGGLRQCPPYLSYLFSRVPSLETISPHVYLICSAGVWDNVPPVYLICQVGFPVPRHCMSPHVYLICSAGVWDNVPLSILFLK